jgi:hypothetical protein
MESETYPSIFCTVVLFPTRTALIFRFHSNRQ